MMRFSKGPLGLHYALVMWMLYFNFFLGLHTINFYLRAKVHQLFIACRYIDCLTDKLKATSVYIFLKEKHALLSPKYKMESPECWKSHFKALNF